MPCGLPHTTHCKYIYVARNPKDVAVSYYHHYRSFYFKDLEWDVFFRLYISGNVPFGTYFDYILSWWSQRNESKILFIKFEDMRKDLVGTIVQIDGSCCSKGTIEDIARKCSFSSMREDVTVSYDWVSYKNKESEPFIRKGEVGDWKNYFSQQQSDKVDVMCQD